jgi:hypothetical protein
MNRTWRLKDDPSNYDDEGKGKVTEEEREIIKDIIAILENAINRLKEKE